MSVLESMSITLSAKAGGTIWNVVKQAYADWQQGRTKRLAMAINPQGGIELLPEDDGVLLGTVYLEKDVEPIVLNGTFLADESFADYVDCILENEDKVVLLFACDEETGEVLLAAFDFEGYEIAFWPGIYSLYTYIIDPEEDEVLALGFPNRGDLRDPNPVALEGSGMLSMDFILFEIDDDLEDEDWDDEDDC